MKKLLIIGVVLVLFGASFYQVKSFVSAKDGISNSTSKNQTGNTIVNQTIKRKAPDFKLKDLNGKEVSLSDFKGKNVYLNFWASWCPPCRAEMPDIEKLYQQTKDSNLVILGVDLGEDSETVKSFIKDNNYNFNILLDSDKSVAEKYNITAIPVSIFIDTNGDIINERVGAMTIDEMQANIDRFDK